MGVGGSRILDDERDRILLAGKPNLDRCDNKISTFKYTLVSFVPVAILEQFRRFANLYFLFVGGIMAIGTYTDLFQSAISPWTTLGPLAAVISFSLIIEGSADRKRHISDNLTNNAPCVILRRSQEVETDPDAEREDTILNGRDVVVSLEKGYFQTSNNHTPDTPVMQAENNLDSENERADGRATMNARIAFQKIRRMDIRQGHLVLVKNRELVPADMIILASSGDNGCAYIETSSIDGETNLKLRKSPDLPTKVLRSLRDGIPMSTFDEQQFDEEPSKIETLEQATKRVARFSSLAYPDGLSALDNPNYAGVKTGSMKQSSRKNRFSQGFDSVKGFMTESIRSPSMRNTNGHRGTYVATLTSEAPNPHVNTFSGKLTLPPVEADGQCFDLALGAENILLRGAVLRNTEWAIGLACFTGTDTKLVQNSFDTPSKFSQLDILMNYTVLAIILIMVLCISYLATQSVILNEQEFDNLWYTGLNGDTSATWPYLPGLDPPEWEEETPNWFQMFFLFVTLLSNFVPLSMYVTVEVINFFFLWLIYVDLDLYDNTTDTRGLARSTNVTDLGRIEYIFSDKTGTLTQNVMRFKRSSVDGSVFGPPVQKSRPGSDNPEDDPRTAYHPVRRLLVGKLSSSDGRHSSKDGLDPLASYHSNNGVERIDNRLTFNAEMFLRVMSLCHTVVVEKDLDLNTNIDSSKSVTSQSSSKSYVKKLFGNRSRGMSDMALSNSPFGALHPVNEEQVVEGTPDDIPRHRAQTAESNLSSNRTMEKGPDGAPAGFAYQAESPDEGALVSSASASFGFQVIGRDSSGIKLRCAHPTIFQDEKVVEGLKSGMISPKMLASESIGEDAYGSATTPSEADLVNASAQRIETWQILAVNKFDSDRKRMSILLRSPPELGSIAVLFCKGADSAMLDPEICSGGSALLSGENDDTSQHYKRSLSAVSEHAEHDEGDDWEMEHIYGLQSHLGEFASEGLRTLVLAMRILTDEECNDWLELHKAAATAMKGRDEKLTTAAIAIEQNLSIVGATAIEDKLQVGVPKTIATLEKAGIKLWVLTGDKRETAIEIGYSTHVLTTKMHVTEVADKGVNYVRAQCAMEFMRLIKAGKLPLYQRAEVDRDVRGCTTENIMYNFGKVHRKVFRALRKVFLTMQKMFMSVLGLDTTMIELALTELGDAETAEDTLLMDVERRRKVRNRAEKIIHEFINSPEGQQHRSRKGGEKEADNNRPADVSGEFALASDELPAVFNRAKSARTILDKSRREGRLSKSSSRDISLAQLTAENLDPGNEALIDEDMLSLNSFVPMDSDETDFDKKRRTIVERLFAVDKDRRKGKLIRHLNKDKRQAVMESLDASLHDATEEMQSTSDGPRALVIEGAALKHMLGDSDLEEVVFSIASGCNAVIACRVSPRQKALLVKLVRTNVSPEPVTLAIGDGANDVGMIQEAHVGIGISGKEGKQAVNASDFAIAQFRFLEDLVLVHGRWNFFRLSNVVMFSFYKNAVMAGCLIVFAAESVYSGTPLFDDWVIAMLNFVAGFPITICGAFDRCLDKDYVRRNPQVYEASRKNELMTVRVLLRWVCITFIHIFSLYHFTVQPLAGGAGMTSAFSGLAGKISEDHPGDGEAADLTSVGTITFTCLVLVLGLKVLFESKSLIHGQWPAITCSDTSEGFFSRLAYTWVGFTFGSIFFWFFFLWQYEIIGKQQGAGSFFNFTGVTSRILGQRSVSWVLIIFVPIFAMSFDVAAKVFSNMYYPTQTQIHIEAESAEKAARKQQLKNTSRPAQSFERASRDNDSAEVDVI